MMNIEPEKPVVLNYERRAPGSSRASLHSRAFAMVVVFALVCAGIAMIAFSFLAMNRGGIAVLGGTLIAVAMAIWNIERPDW